VKRAIRSPELHAVDVRVGGRLRLRRTLLGMTQQELGRQIDLTFQQVQKYEKGTNRIGAGMLLRLGEILDVPVSFFFEAAAGGSRDDRQLMRRETLEVVRAYYAISDPRARQRVLAVLRGMSRLADKMPV
jgi:transcriptional regulator with XRE-family HTH domain